MHAISCTCLGYNTSINLSMKEYNYSFFTVRKGGGSPSPETVVFRCPDLQMVPRRVDAICDIDIQWDVKLECKPVC